MSGAQSISTRRGVWRAAGLPRVAPRPLQCVCAAAGDTVPCAVSSPRADRRCPGRRPGGPHSPGARSLAVSWRGVPEGLGEAAGRRDSDLAGTGAAVDAGVRPPGPAARGPRARAKGARRDHHHRGARRDVGHGHDGHRDRRRGGSLRLRGRRSLRDRVHRAPCRQARERFEALEPIRQGIRERFGGIGDGVARGLRLRHDHGSNYLADDFQQEVAFFGIESSPSFVREPEGNGVAERFIRTLKENGLVDTELRDDRGAPPGFA